MPWFDNLNPSIRYKSYGVIAEPEIFKLEKAPFGSTPGKPWRSLAPVGPQELEDGSGHFILASDGVWEFLTNEDVATLAHSCWDCRSVFEILGIFQA